jgi:hypothetical protein
VLHFRFLQQTYFILINGDLVIFQRFCYYVQSPVIDDCIGALLRYILWLNLKLAVAPLWAVNPSLVDGFGVGLTEIVDVDLRFVWAKRDPLWLNVECYVIYGTVGRAASELKKFLAALR